jgi:anti-anti-sigma regulatory factor
MTKQRPELELELPADFADCGSLGWLTLARLRLFLLAASDATTSPVLVLSLTNIQRGGAAFIGVLLETHHGLQRSSRRLKLRNMQQQVAGLLNTCHLTNLFA